MLWAPQAFFWRFKSKVPVSQYADVYSQALRAGLLFRDLGYYISEYTAGVEEDDVDIERLTDEAFQQSLEDWKNLKEKMNLLEKSRPDNRELVGLHYRTLGLLRGAITAGTRLNHSYIELGKGNAARRRSLSKNARSWEDVARRSRRNVVEALRSLQSNHPALYDALNLDIETLEQLNLPTR